VTSKRDFSSRPRRRAARPVDLAVLAAGTAAFVLSGYATTNAWNGRQRARARVEETRRESEAVQARVRELDARREPAQGIAYQALLTAEAPPPRVLADLVALMPGDVRLDAVSMTYGEPLGLRVDVVARTASSYDLFLDRLQRSPLFTDVLPGVENRDGELRTSIQMTYRPLGGAQRPPTPRARSDGTPERAR
jgi:Tfp pilus assembly protein PilN